MNAHTIIQHHPLAHILGTHALISAVAPQLHHVMDPTFLQE